MPFFHVTELSIGEHFLKFLLSYRKVCVDIAIKVQSCFNRIRNLEGIFICYLLIASPVLSIKLICHLCPFQGFDCNYLAIIKN